MIKVASYNIRKGIGTDRRRRPERILEVLREIDADIIALQEADRRFGARERRDHRAPAGGTQPVEGGAVRHAGRRRMGWHGNALLVRKDMPRSSIASRSICPRWNRAAR